MPLTLLATALLAFGPPAAGALAAQAPGAIIGECGTGPSPNCPRLGLYFNRAEGLSPLVAISYYGRNLDSLRGECDNSSVPACTALAQHYESFHQVLEFADIARP